MRDNRANESFARKVIHIFGTLTIEDVQKELNAIHKLQRDGGHKNIVNVLRHGELEYMSLYYIDMELCDLNLADFINGQRSSMVTIDLQMSRSANIHIPSNLKLAMILDIMNDIANGVAFIHGCKIIHRDLKPPNVLYSGGNQTWKIADFGLTVDGTSKHPIITVNATGTPSYRAPELLRGVDFVYTNKVDIWALGCIFYELLFGRKAFAGDFAVREYSSSLELLNIPVTSTILGDVSPWRESIKRIIVRTLHKDPSKRGTARDVRYHIGALAMATFALSKGDGSPERDVSIHSNNNDYDYSDGDQGYDDPDDEDYVDSDDEDFDDPDYGEDPDDSEDGNFHELPDEALDVYACSECGGQWCGPIIPETLRQKLSLYWVAGAVLPIFLSLAVYFLSPRSATTRELVLTDLSTNGLTQPLKPNLRSFGISSFLFNHTNSSANSLSHNLLLLRDVVPFLLVYAAMIVVVMPNRMFSGCALAHLAASVLLGLWEGLSFEGCIDLIILLTTLFLGLVSVCCLVNEVVISRIPETGRVKIGDSSFAIAIIEEEARKKKRVVMVENFKAFIGAGFLLAAVATLHFEYVFLNYARGDNACYGT